MSMRGNPAHFLIQCKGCRETFSNIRKPFALSCSPGHRLCEKCLDDYTRKVCPQCRKPLGNRNNLRIDKTVLERALKATKNELGNYGGSSDDLLFTGAENSSACPRCHSQSETFKMVCPHCSELVCQKCAAHDLNVYLPLLQTGYTRYLDLLNNVNGELDKHVKNEQAKIDKFYEDRKREAKNQLMSSVKALNIHKKREDAENIVNELDRFLQESERDRSRSESESSRRGSGSEFVEHEFHALCNLIIRAEKIRRNQLVEPDIDFSEAVVHIEHFNEKIGNRADKFIKHPLSFSLESVFDGAEKQTFDQLFSPSIDARMNRINRQKSVSDLSVDGFATPRPRTRKFFSISSPLKTSSNSEMRRNTSYGNLSTPTPTPRYRKPSLGFNKL